MNITEEEFLEIIERNKSRLKHLCRVYSVRNDEMEDLYQEIIIQIWRSLSSFQGEAKISTWIYRLAVNTAISMNRKRKTRRKYHKAYKNEMVGSKRGSNQGLEDENVKKLYSAIGKLGTAEKTITTMYLEEFSYKEIAYVTGITENYVGVKLNRIKKKLSEMVKA